MKNEIEKLIDKYDDKRLEEPDYYFQWEEIIEDLKSLKFKFGVDTSNRRKMRMAKIKQKAKDESENEVKQQVADYLIKAGYTLYRINNAPVAFKRFHGKKGVSDTIAFKPGEYALALEGKATGKKPSDEQREFLELVNTSKGIVGFHYDSLDRFLQLYNDIKNGYGLPKENKLYT